jgi:hypothetical protein
MAQIEFHLADQQSFVLQMQISSHGGGRIDGGQAGTNEQF